MVGLSVFVLGGVARQDFQYVDYLMVNSTEINANFNERSV
jgi:hypothetical protein